MTVHVAAASKHGATLEIAETIARILEESGIEAEFIELDEVGDLGGYDALRGRKRDLPLQLAQGGSSSACSRRRTRASTSSSPAVRTYASFVFWRRPLCAARTRVRAITATGARSSAGPRRSRCS